VYLYSSVGYEGWDKYDGEIGSVQTPDDVDKSQFIGARMKFQYIMLKSVFVKENMAYEDIELTSCNDCFFSLKMEISNPEVPYGNTFRSLSRSQARTYRVPYNHQHALSKGRWDGMLLRYGDQFDLVIFFNIWERTGRRKYLTPQRVWRKWHVSECRVPRIRRHRMQH
jgi:hypothetical protein